MGDSISQAMAKLRDPKGHVMETFFPTGNRVHFQRDLEREKKKDQHLKKKFLKPENTHDILKHYKKSDGFSMHCLACGNFEMCDLILGLIKKLGKNPSSCHFASLGISIKNLEKIVGLMNEKGAFQLDVLLSKFFEDQSGKVKEAIEKEALSNYPDHIRFHVFRSHAKVFLLDFGDFKVAIEGSANLRSANSVEQFSIHNDDGLYAFHLDWIKTVINHGKLNHGK